jgi:hypothetical protein
MSDPAATFLRDGWLRFPAEPSVLAWAVHALPVAIDAAADRANAHWLRCGGTWFVGVDALPNDAEGRIGGGLALAGAARDFTSMQPIPALPLHRAQLSICYPGYPQPMAGESERAFAYRRDRDAAHVDGLLAEGAPRQRFLRESHAWILGITLASGDGDASPTVLWKGSHVIMRAAFARAFDGVEPERWGDVDLTAIYGAARREVFERCTRVVLALQPGEACVFHRHLLHGMALWTDGAMAPPWGRIIAWFRPQFATLQEWMAEG